MTSSDSIYMVTAICAALGITVIVNGFVPMFGIGPLFLLLFCIGYPIAFSVTMHERRRALEERMDIKRLARKLQEPTCEALPAKVGGSSVASTGCALTDQIFEAARRKGINPVDVIGPALEYEEEGRQDAQEAKFGNGF